MFRTTLEFHKECQKLPARGAIKDQLDRASLSVVCNTAEGAGRKTPNDKKHFYTMAYGSLRETEALIDILDATHLKNLLDQIGACLWVLSRK